MSKLIARCIDGTRVYQDGNSAIKQIPTRDGLPTGRSLIEIAALKHLRHPGVVRLERYKITSDVTRLYTPLADMDLHAYLQTHKNLSIQRIRRWGAQLVRALYYAISMDFLNCDIKPSNILIYGDQLVIGDWNTTQRGQGEYGSRMMPVYTLWYRAPEIIKREYPSEKSEIWALGCVLMEMVLNRPLFNVSNANELETEIERLLDPLSSRSLNCLLMEHVTSNGLRNLFRRIFVLNPPDRISITDLISHPFFRMDPMVEDLNFKRVLLEIMPLPVQFDHATNIMIAKAWIFELYRPFDTNISHQIIYVFEAGLSKLTVDNRNLQLLAIAAIFIVRHHLGYIQKFELYTDFADNKYTADEIRTMVIQLLQAIDCRLIFSTPYDFLMESLYQNWNVTDITLAERILALVTSGMNIYKYSPDSIAQAVTDITRYELGLRSCPQTQLAVRCIQAMRSIPPKYQLWVIGKEFDSSDPMIDRQVKYIRFLIETYTWKTLIIRPGDSETAFEHFCWTTFYEIPGWSKIRICGLDSTTISCRDRYGTTISQKVASFDRFMTYVLESGFSIYRKKKRLNP